MTTFGESAPAELLFEEFGFTVGQRDRQSESAAVILNFGMKRVASATVFRYIYFIANKAFYL